LTVYRNVRGRFILAEQFGLIVPFVLAAVVRVAGLALAVLLTQAERPTIDDPAGMLAVLRAPGTASAVTIMLLSAAVIGIIEPVLPLHLADRFCASQALTSHRNVAQWAAPCATRVVGSRRTGKFTERAMKHLASTSSCSPCGCSHISASATVTAGRSTTFLNWPPPSCSSTIVPVVVSV